MGTRTILLLSKGHCKRYIASDTPIREVRFTKNEVSGTTKDSRGGLFDMTYEDELGRVFIVEMQLLNLSSLIYRPECTITRFYARRLARRNLSRARPSQSTPDQRAEWEMTIAGNMSVKAYWEEEIEKDKAKLRKETEARVKKEASKKLKEAKKEAVIKMIRRGFDATEVSEIINMPITSVEAICGKKVATSITTVLSDKLISLKNNF